MCMGVGDSLMAKKCWGRLPFFVRYRFDLKRHPPFRMSRLTLSAVSAHCTGVSRLVLEGLLPVLSKLCDMCWYRAITLTPLGRYDVKRTPPLNWNTIASHGCSNIWRTSKKSRHYHATQRVGCYPHLSPLPTLRQWGRWSQSFVPVPSDQVYSAPHFHQGPRFNAVSVDGWWSDKMATKQTFSHYQRLP